MRIALAVQNYFPPNNGQAVFVRRLAEGLVRRGHHVCVLTPSEDGPAQVLSRHGVRIHALRSVTLAPVYPGVSVTWHADGAAAEVLENFSPQVVHIHDHFPLCAAAARVTHRHGWPMLATNHFMPQNIIPFVPLLSRLEWGRHQMERFMWNQVLAVFRYADLAAAPTRTAARMLEAAGQPGPVHALSCGLDLSAFRLEPRVNRDEVRARYGIDARRPTFMFIGRVDREKRIDVLIDALPLLPRSDVQLVIAGSGRDRDALIDQARALGLEDRVLFPGFIPEEDVMPLLNSIDAFAIASEAELQSIATLQAMACGRPILAADAAALPELVENGVNGYLFRAGDPEHAAWRMRQLLDESHRWAQMGEASLEGARRHDFERTLDAHESLYRSLGAAAAA